MTETSNHFDITKTANIQASTTYPVVSAYEFEFLKGEAIIRERLDDSTIYLIVQRPLTYFDNVELHDGLLRFEITDDQATPLKCQIDLVEAGICTADEVVDIEMSFFKSVPDTAPPYRQVGAIKVFKPDGDFVVWWSPQKLLYEIIINGLPVKSTGDGDPMSFLDYKVHYIGQAFSQKVWDRLTGHDKMQRILTTQGSLGILPQNRPAFEIGIILLSVVGLTDMPEIGGMDAAFPASVEPIRHSVDPDNEGEFESLMFNGLVELGDKAMTTEVEAMLINQFRPTENCIKFDAYPNIKGGMRSKGYTHTELTIERLPALLYTDHYRLLPVIV